jgi:hypothetical protein
MKKIISFLVIAAVMAACFIAVIPASAATKTFEIDWTALAYTAYNENGYEVDEFTFLDSFEVTKNATTLGVSRIGAGVQSNSYISTSQFAITADTSYTFEIMAKNNNTTKYSGVPFAIGPDGMVYFIYGSFDNNNDSDSSQSGKSYVISAMGDFDNKYPNSTGNELDSIYFKKLQLSNGFASFKFEYNGLNVTIYAKDTNGNYAQMGEVVPLPEGSKLVFGVFSRDNNNNGNRTTTVKNAKITGNNDAAVKNMVIESNNGASELKAEILRVEKEYPEVDYTKATYADVKDALEKAKAVAEDSFSTADEVTAALEALNTAVEGLELAEPDFSELEEAIESAEELKAVEYTEITFKMVLEAVDNAKELLESDDVRQSQINAAIEAINGRIASLVPSGEKAPEDEDDGEDADATTPATQAPIPQAPDTGVVPVPGENKGCKSSVAATAAVMAVVATLGTALVIKKKD